MIFRSTGILLLTAVCLASCMPPATKHDLPIPDKIEVKKSPGHVQIYGTKIFIVPPRGSKQDSVNHKLFIDNRTEIHFLEYNAKSFSVIREEKFGRYLLSQKEDPGSKDLHFYKYFLLGNDSAAVAYRINPITKTAEITWLVGNSTSAISANGTFPSNQTGTRDEILTALQSIYVDTSAYVDYAAISHYTIDTVGTDFKQYHREKDIVFYTSIKDGGTDYNIATVTPIPIGLTEDISFEASVSTYLQNAKRVHKLEALMVDTRKTTINGRKAIQCSYQITTPQGSWKCFFLVVSDGQRSAIFSGSVPLGEDGLFKRMKAFAGTIRII